MSYTTENLPIFLKNMLQTEEALNIFVNEYNAKESAEFQRKEALYAEIQSGKQQLELDVNANELLKSNFIANSKKREEEAEIEHKILKDKEMETMSSEDALNQTEKEFNDLVVERSALATAHNAVMSAGYVKNEHGAYSK